MLNNTTLFTPGSDSMQVIAEVHTQMHNLSARGLSVENATSFIIIISVGFVAFTLLCAATSIYYRRRMMLAYRGDLPLDDQSLNSQDLSLLPKPQLWDISIDKFEDSLANDYENLQEMLPLAARLVPSSHGNPDADAEAEAADTVPASRVRRWGLRRTHGVHGEQPPTIPQDPLNEDVQVVMLISMPSESASNSTSMAAIPHSPTPEGNVGAHMHGSAEFGSSFRPDYAIGILQTPYPKEAEKPGSA